MAGRGPSGGVFSGTSLISRLPLFAMSSVYAAFFRGLSACAEGFRRGEEKCEIVIHVCLKRQAALRNQAPIL